MQKNGGMVKMATYLASPNKKFQLQVIKQVLERRVADHEIESLHELVETFGHRQVEHPVSIHVNVFLQKLIQWLSLRMTEHVTYIDHVVLNTNSQYMRPLTNVRGKWQSTKIIYAIII